MNPGSRFAVLTSVKLKLNYMASPPLTIVIASNSAGSVEFVVTGTGKCPGQEFLDDDCEKIREKGRKKPGSYESSARAKFMVLFEQMARYGTVSPKRFKREMNNLFAFSHEVKNVQIRFPCFQDGKAWIVTHGFPKPGAQKGLGKWPDSEVKRAEELRGEYLTRKKGKK